MVQLVIVKAQAALEQLAVIVAQCLEELTYQAARLRQQRQIIRQQCQLQQQAFAQVTSEDAGRVEVCR